MAETASAHSKNSVGVRHDLVAHLRAVAERAAAFARPFGAEDLARAAGLYHDLGKFHPDFQRYLDWCEDHPGKRGSRVDHKAAGATLARQSGPLLPLIIMAHHGGLRTRSDLKFWLNDPALADRVGPTLDLVRRALPDLDGEVPPIPLPAGIATEVDGELFLRMLFSCLVDADFLDTEAHFDTSKAASRPALALDAARLATRLAQYRDTLTAEADPGLTSIRARVYAACESAGACLPGVYRMTVPTGGGKTIAGMAFALRHATQHAKRRVIVATPYRSITEQTAGVYRSAFGEAAVLEHHSGVRGDEREEGDGDAMHSWERLAAENWDAPVVVTTTVQFFESLFKNRVSTSRKLHNICDSVVILDEVQFLPAKFLTPILNMLEELVARYGVTVLLSTATQPDYTPFGVEAREIAPDPDALFASLRRVRYEFAPAAWSWDDAARALAAERQAMMVLNTKKDCFHVLDALEALGVRDGVLHLSTNLCGAHREARLEEVRRRLGPDGDPCRLVSTQVVEAGVDLDFPAVFRADGPLDRIIQSAGRCNRNGKQELGRMTVFNAADGGLPPGEYRTATQLGRIEAIDFHDPFALAPWYRLIYDTLDTDAEQIQRSRAALDFPGVAQKFRMIVDDAEDVIVPYDDGRRGQADDAIEQLRAKRGKARELLRKVQPYTVGLRRGDLERAVRRGIVAAVFEGVWELRAPELYDPVRGLRVEGADTELLQA